MENAKTIESNLAKRDARASCLISQFNLNLLSVTKVFSYYLLATAVPRSNNVFNSFIFHFIVFEKKKTDKKFQPT